ncbi:MAG TPA: leucine-rich repeat domain-containing protein [Chitinophagaceae bacterium]|nr:leucine-rich repeat domain-containing protein [Chitinophagaceae bacterium]HPH33045.1 leucine-rich repeat domain-containing protein [Chitinophagaceae bacterium]HPN60311.1 leucine-rich repeat domain-containing protein [Chitinophagaceae bacterium]
MPFSYNFGEFPGQTINQGPKLINFSEYKGEADIELCCTQLDNTTAKEQAKIVDEWCDHLSNNTLPLKSIWMETRISQKIFDAICKQTSLTSLWIKWGVYPDLSAISQLTNLEHLHLGNGTSITDLSPVGRLPQLKTLESDGLVNVHDYRFLSSLTALQDLDIEGDGFSSMKPVLLSDLKFLESIPWLQRLCLKMVRVKDKDYSPILKIKDLKWLSLPHYKEVQQQEHLFKNLY